MKKIIAVFAILLIVLIGIVFLFNNGNGGKPKNQATLGANSTGQSIQPSATPSLTSGSVTIGNHSFHVQVAKTTKEQEQGLSGRLSLPVDQGMLFIFDKPYPLRFWMRDMKFPLDIIFITGQKIVTIDANALPPENNGNLPIFQATQDADKVLEINAGLSKKYNYKVGNSVQISL